MKKSSNFFHVGGTLSKNSPSYIKRKADDEIFEILLRNEYCLVLAPRQSGKSSLMVHTIKRLETENIKAGAVDLQPYAKQSDPEVWFRDVLYQIENSFKLSVDSGEWWDSNKKHGFTQRFIMFLERVVLKEHRGDVVIFFDEIETILQLPFSDDFFTTLRYLYNSRAINNELQRLTIALVGLTSPSKFIQDHSRTPFNIGTMVHLNDFKKESTDPFKKVLGNNSGEVIERIFYWTNGQPLLVQQLAAIAYSWPEEIRNAKNIDREVDKKYFKPRIETDTHLNYIRDYLLDDEKNLRSILCTYRDILNAKEIMVDNQSPAQDRLRLSGVVKNENNLVVPRNRIYQQVFSQAWIKQNMPSSINSKIAIISSLTSFVLAIVWILIIQPLLVPEFTPISSIERNTSEPSIEITFSVNDASKAYYNDELIPLRGKSDDFFSKRLASLPVGKSKDTIKLVGGLFSMFEKIIPVIIYHYPNWEVRQFPNPILGLINPIVINKGKNIILKNAYNGVIWDTLRGHQSDITCTAISQDKKTLLSGSQDGIIKIWQLPNYTSQSGFRDKYGLIEENRRLVREIRAHNNAVSFILFKNDTSFISGGDSTIKVWNVSTTKTIKVLTNPKGNVLCAAFIKIPSGKSFKQRIAIGSDNGIVNVWDLDTYNLHDNFRDSENEIRSIIITGDGGIISASRDGRITMRNSKGHILQQNIESNSPISDLRISPEGNRIAWGYDSTLMVRNLSEPWDSVEYHSSYNIDRIMFVNNNLVMTQAISEEPILFDLSTGKIVPLYIGHKKSIADIEFLDQNLIVSSDFYKYPRSNQEKDSSTYKLWDIGSGELLKSIILNKNKRLLDFSKNGDSYATVDNQGNISLFNTMSDDSEKISTKRDTIIYGKFIKRNKLVLFSRDSIWLFDTENYKQLTAITYENVFRPKIFEDISHIFLVSEKKLKGINTETGSIVVELPLSVNPIADSIETLSNWLSNHNMNRLLINYYGKLHLIDFNKNKLLPLNVNMGIYGSDISAKGDRLVAMTDSLIVQWDIASDSMINDFPIGERPWALWYIENMDRNLVSTVGRWGTDEIIDMDSLKVIRKWRDYDSRGVYSTLFGRNYITQASENEENNFHILTVYDNVTFESLRTYSIGQNSIREFNYDRKKKLIATGSSDGILKLFWLGFDPSLTDDEE